MDIFLMFIWNFIKMGNGKKYFIIIKFILMITILKLREYEKYHGYYDGFYHQKVKQGIHETNDEEWFLISKFIQNMRLINKGLTSNEFSENLEKSLKENCDNKDSINLLKKLANDNW